MHGTVWLQRVLSELTNVLGVQSTFSNALFFSLVRIKHERRREEEKEKKRAFAGGGKGKGTAP